MKIFLILLCLAILYVFSIILLLFLTKRVFVKKSLGYIKALDYSKVCFFPISFSIKITLSGVSIPYIKIENIRVKFLSFRYLKFIFPKSFHVYHDDFIKKIHFDSNPIFSINLSKSKNLNLVNPLLIELIHKDKVLNSEYKDSKIILDKFIIKNIISDELKTSIELNYHFEHVKVTHHKAIIDLEVGFGVSQRTKARYLKSINLKDLDINFPNSKISANGKIIYKAMSNPEGQILCKVENINYLTSDIFIKKDNKFFERVMAFTNYIMDNGASNDNLSIIEFLFQDNGTFINNIELSEIRKKLNR